MAKMDYKKEFKDLYLPGKEPCLVEVPSIQFAMIDGKGDPNSQHFQDAVEALYSISYGIKMMPKKGPEPDGYFDYTVPPLEGLWWIVGEHGFSFTDRLNWRWTAMIRQPEFVTEELFSRVKEEVGKKRKNELLEDVRFDSFEEGLCVQIMHIGPYSQEPETVDRLDSFISQNNLRSTFYRDGKHHEIYLSDPRRAKPETMKTVIRHPVEEI